MFAIEYLMAECELLTADKVAAESRICGWHNARGTGTTSVS